MKIQYRSSDLMRALAISRPSLMQQLGDRELGIAAGWRTWSRGEAAKLALERALITAGLAVAAARTVASQVLPEDPFDAVTITNSWLVIAAKPDRWVFGLVRSLDGIKPGAMPWPFVVLHPRTIVAAAFERLDSDNAPEIAQAQPVTRRPAVASQLQADGRARFTPEAFA